MCVCVWKLELSVNHSAHKNTLSEKICMLSSWLVSCTHFPLRNARLDDVYSVAALTPSTVHGLNKSTLERISPPNEWFSYENHRKYKINEYRFAEQALLIRRTFAFCWLQVKWHLVLAFATLGANDERSKSSRTNKWAINKIVMQFDITFKMRWWCWNDWIEAMALNSINFDSVVLWLVLPLPKRLSQSYYFGPSLQNINRTNLNGTHSLWAKYIKFLFANVCHSVA